ncbi:MAG: bifunctional folylpolyglutamate synthase/dihydrofolate synthase [Tenacibaculum sp.]
MTYLEATQWMFVKLPMYQRDGKIAFKKNLSNIIAFCAYLGNPEKKFKSIHVGGTNGKGSTSHMLASILQEAKYKVGLYTSPHLKSFTERIRINGLDISKEKVIDFVQQNKGFIDKQKLSFFEMTVGFAFSEFAREKVDIAVIEVGLGGRLDSTNIITPEVSVITNIGLDHTQFLGHTLQEIAQEKAGIIKTGIPVIIGQKQQETTAVFVQRAEECCSEIVFASESKTLYSTDLLGDYQKFNIKTALTALKYLKDFKIKQIHIQKGLLNTVKNTGIEGRWQVLQTSPKIICDTAHNKEALLCVLNQLKKEEFKTLHIVLGFVSDKNLDQILPLFPKQAMYYFCKPAIPRGLSESKLQAKAKQYELKGEKYPSVASAYNHLLFNLKINDLAYIGGSNFVVAEVLYENSSEQQTITN